MFRQNYSVWCSGVKNMQIQNSTINIVFPRVENIKKQFILNEDVLKENFNEANILPIPDEAPEEIPRIIVKTKHEHSQLSIAPSAINFKTNYTGEYVTKWQKCHDYINSRVGDIYEFANELTGNEYSYMGIVTNLLWDQISENGDSILYKNIFNKNKPENLDDILLKFTFVEKNKYYVNITIQSVQVFENINSNSSGEFCKDNLRMHTISVMLDINDRYSFNNEKNYVSKKQTFEELIELTKDVINNKLETLIEKGVY